MVHQLAHELAAQARGEFIPPPVGATDVTVDGSEREPLMLWVMEGQAEVVQAGGARHLGPGAALLLPPGTAFRLRTSPRTALIPVFSRQWDVTAGAGQTVPVDLDPSWGDWLVHQFGRSLGYLRGEAPTADPAGADPMGVDHTAVDHTGGDPIAADPMAADPTAVGPMGTVRLLPAPCDGVGAVAGPPMPSSPDARRVARAIRQDPGAGPSLEALARMAHLGVRTLQAHFMAETGRSLSQWRRETRIHAAAHHLAQGRSVGWVQREVGYATPAGFTKAFSAIVGCTPQAYRVHCLRAGVRPRPGEGFAQDGLARPLAPAPFVPSSRTWGRVNDFHVLVWFFRGVGEVTSGGRCHLHQQGDVVWLPAHVPNHIDLAPGAILLPLGSRPAGSAPGAGVVSVLRAHPRDDATLLATAVANYTAFHAPSHDPLMITRSFLEQGMVARADATRDPAIERVLAEFRSNPGCRQSLASWAAQAGIDAEEFARRFRAATSTDYAHWVALLRMSRARLYLDEGMPVRAVARRLGYRSPSSFGVVFKRFHGVAPTEFRKLDNHSQEELLVR